MIVAHLTASPFFGGPERQMLGLATSLPPDCKSVFLCLWERGLARPFLDQLRAARIRAVLLRSNTPHLIAAVGEVAKHLRRSRVDVLCCHGYKPDLVGYFAARRAGIPVVAVSRGWTGATMKVRFYEKLDRLCLRLMDHVACVSEAQARKVRTAGVGERKITVIRNAIYAERFDNPDPAYRRRLEEYFKMPVRRVVCAAGRLSPEKGFSVLINAAAIVARAHRDVGFVLFGDGPLRDEMLRQISRLGLEGRFIIAGFNDQVDRFMPHADVVVLPSFTEGLPNVALEALAAGVPVVATAVGGTPEVVVDKVCGYLVSPGDPPAMAGQIARLLQFDDARRAMGRAGREHVCANFTFRSQATRYQQLFGELCDAGGAPSRGGQLACEQK